MQQTGISTVVVAGGIMANVKLNQRIFEIPDRLRGLLGLLYFSPSYSDEDM